MSLTGDETNMRPMQTPYTNNFDSPQDQKPRNNNPDPNFPGSSKPKQPKITYRECLKNHAASMGGTVTDGCGEFMPSGEEGTLEALKCAACSCHRNFHRRETPHHHYLALPPPLPSPSVVQPMKIAFGGGSSVGTESSSEELNFAGYGQQNNNNNNNNRESSMVVAPPPHFAGKKRFRTKFTAEQKEKMMAFAEKLGWRIPREDDSEMQRFCAEVGVKRQVFKVWMHNNKITSPTSNPKKIPASATAAPHHPFN